MHEMRHDICEKHAGEETSDVAIAVHFGFPLVDSCLSKSGRARPLARIWLRQQMKKQAKDVSVAERQESAVISVTKNEAIAADQGH